MTLSYWQYRELVNRRLLITFVTGPLPWTFFANYGIPWNVNVR